MYLKSIEIQGFKSFANKMLFEFHNGITGIVGPNGSGKSNVADAVRWVLGEQSAKQLRGGNMTDVIFSGTQTRKPQGFAYVAITLDNSDHKLDTAYEEVTVARRIYRSGESEYLLNGMGCRLRDVQELFYDTGIGKEGYSIIGQGQIERILSGKPEERRELFDEAAGIVKFKRRKNTSLKKLEEEQQNLIRVQDILSELEKQLEPLERQSQSARQYLKRKEELKVLELQMFLIEMEKIRSQLGEVMKKSQIAKEDLQDTAKLFEQAKRDYEKSEQEIENFEEKIEKLKETSKEYGIEAKQLEGQKNVLKEQIKTAVNNKEHSQARMDTVAVNIEKYEQEKIEIEKEHQEVAILLEESLQKQKEQENLLTAMESSYKEISEKIEANQQEIIRILNQRSSIKGKLQRFDTMLEQIGIRKSQLGQRALLLKTQEGEQQEALKQSYEQEKTIREELRTGDKEIRSFETQLLEYDKKIAEANHQLEIGQRTFHREESRLEALKDLTERYDGYGNSIRKVMEQKESISGIKGVVADLVKVSKKYELAIETALGGNIQNIVTDHEQTAKSMIEFLKKNKYGRATFLPLSNLKGKNIFLNQKVLEEKGVVGAASDLVKSDAEYQNLVLYLLGRTLVVNEIDQAIYLAKKYGYTYRIVTLEGELLNPGGSMTGGAFKNNSNLLGRRREIEELSSSILLLKKDLEKVKTQNQEYIDARQKLSENLKSKREKRQERLLRKNTITLEIQTEKQKVEEIQDGYLKLDAEKKEIETQIHEVNESNQAIESEVQESNLREEKIKNQNQILQEKYAEYQNQTAQKREILESAHLEYAALVQKLEFQEQNLVRIQRSIEELKEEQEALGQNLRVDDENILEKENQITQLNQKIEQNKEEIRAIEAGIQEGLKKKESMTAEHKKFFENRDSLSEKMNLLDKESFRLANQQEKLEEEENSKVTYMWEEYEVTFQKALAETTDRRNDASEMKKEIGNVKEAIRKLGNVNVNAIEEYKQVLERYTFLQNQHEDLVESEKTLMKIIEELDTGMRKQFAEKFELISQEFNQVFQQLFGGGKGTLILDEQEDILEAGITIVSQPPGKKLQNMMQLSGGEKALTAIALLFAIQNLKPSPFCLLDEIEAALDDSNVTRFAQYLHKLTEHTQFIVITHRRGTMNAADRLYGITMQEKGISALVSVDLIDKQLNA